MNYGNISIEEYEAERRRPTFVVSMERQLRMQPYHHPFMPDVACLLEALAREYEWHPARKWRFDYAHLRARVALELEGLVWHEGHGSGRSRHTDNAGYTKDCVKYSAAAAHGWLVVRATPPMVKDGTALALFIDTLVWKKQWFGEGK